ncbi:unnamed protein product [Echinostoma caproni]|uniref:LIM zinc-binding domain-containing protein n=1 Tax=Echinostoma caproni TaxID=27848 RepID=A0A183AJ90_9TREM|nr:unnamed protein product [Echinostoma caproni]
MDRSLRGTRGIPLAIPSSNPSSGTNTPRRKPILAPLRRSYSKTGDPNIPWTSSKTTVRSSASPDARLDSKRILCRSIDSELSEVTSIRSAASHRRAMRLFEEAERKRRQGDSLQSDEDRIRRSLQEPLRVSVTEANCAVPVLDPVVVPALPVQRSTLAKATAQRRTTSGSSMIGASLSGPPTNVDHKPITTSTALDNSSIRSTPGAKYNPYTGASFRENPDYADLVIGHAAGCSPSSTTHVPSAPLEVIRTGSNQLHGLHERRPLRGLFDPTPIQPQQPISPQSSNLTLGSKHIGPDAPTKPSRTNVTTTDTSASVVPAPSDSGEEHQMLGASVVGIGLTDAIASVPPLEKANISTIEPEAQVSTVFRQRILQKKNKELQKLRKGATNSEAGESHPNESGPAKTSAVKSDVNHRHFPVCKLCDPDSHSNGSVPL